jgi:hypothetical protein
VEDSDRPMPLPPDELGSLPSLRTLVLRSCHEDVVRGDIRAWINQHRGKLEEVRFVNCHGQMKELVEELERDMPELKTSWDRGAGRYED